jgi:riboflavin kinase/FMN adenylyltransferase
VFQASAAIPAEAFIEDILLGGLQTRHLMVGDDFRFGQKRSGNFETLQAASQRHGFGLDRLDTLIEDGERISSSRVRAALAVGDFDAARALLGRPYFLSGRVGHGRKLGRTLGFPTINLRIPFENPAVSGIFVVQVHGVEAQPLPAVASLGTRPAVEANGRLLLEVHLLDWSGDLYGRRVQVEFLRRLREERHYDQLEALRAQIDLDAQQARDYFAARRAAPDSSRGLHG